MPYKHIAAHLKKTELACRLHYHQLSHGSHRRKRTSSLSSSSSGGSVRHSPPQYHLNGDPHDDYRNALHGHQNIYGSINPMAPYPVNNSLAGRSQHKMLLPKPRPLTPEDSPTRMHGGLRIHTNSPGNNVDTDRLRQIYDSRRGSFWSSIAQEYGTEVSPRHLEEVWRSNGPQPPTPDDSPNRQSAIHPMLQPSPFPPFAPSMHHPVKDFGSMSLPSNGPSPSDRYSYGMPTPQSSYTNTPSMGRLPQNSWSNGMNQQPATAITSLLTEDKCPRHPESRYCVGGRCI